MKNIILKYGLIGVLLVLLTSSRIAKSDFFEIAKQLEIFTTLFKELNMNYVDQTNPARLMDTAISAMLMDLDPYTVFWNEQEVQEARINSSGEYTGIGATVFIRKDKIIIAEPYKGYPADLAGLRAGDEILEIGGISVSGFAEDAGELLNGAPVSSVTIAFLRQGEKKTTTLTRGSIEVKAVPFYQLLADGSGYIVLSQFNRNASSETAAALQDLKKQGADRIILDLRGNPGGLLSEAINVSNIFLPKGELVTSTRSAVEKYNQEFFTTKQPIDPTIPLVVVINSRSASASEIVAGALQDLDRAVIVGARSFGKGLVQRPKELSYGTQLKVTISRYYTPSGRCIQALDYRNRNESGDAVRISSSDYKEFSTRNGRKVYDGGGITPDVEIHGSDFSGIAGELLRQNHIFDYATLYYYSNSIESPEAFVFTDEDFQDFTSFLDKKNFDYKTATEEQLEILRETAKEEGIAASLAEDIVQLEEKIASSHSAALREEKQEIVSLLTDEILKRYFYKEGLYQYYVDHNQEIKVSRDILNNAERYKDILR